MALRILSSETYRVMPWKNGLGTTTELFIRPEGSTVADGFDLRISRAQVGSSGPFSPFPGCDRTLLLLRGGPLTVVLEDGTALALDRPLAPVCFSGDRGATGLLDGEPCEDFNVITRRAALRHRLSVVCGEGPHEPCLGQGWAVWYVVEGILAGAHPGELVWVDSKTETPLQGVPEGRYLRIDVEPVSDVSRPR